MNTIEQAREVSLRLKRAPLQNGSNFHSEVADTIDALLAELAALKSQEPVAYRWVWKSKPHDIEGWCYTDARYPPASPELQEIQTLYLAAGAQAVPTWTDADIAKMHRLADALDSDEPVQAGAQPKEQP